LQTCENLFFEDYSVAFGLLSYNLKHTVMELQIIQQKIHEIRGQKVMLDFDLAELYETDTKVLKQAVKRNLERFPSDFMIELSSKEFKTLRSQIVTSKRGGTQYKPFAFTEQGVAMLSSVLNSAKAIQVNIHIMRAFVLIRRFALTYRELAEKIAGLEEKYDHQFADVNEALDLLLTERENETDWENRERIGFKK